jgi:simple sugar transport system ATP-binding protein
VSDLALQMVNITKRYGNVIANDRVSIDLQKGEILGLLGENGTGKTTLMKILFGLIQPDEGKIVIDRAELKVSNPQVASAMGIGMVHQHFSLSPDLTVSENIVLGLEPTRKWLLYDYQKTYKITRELCNRFGLEVDPLSPVKKLSLAHQQRVEILKALYRQAKILILDEPTAVLAPQEIEDLFRVIRELSRKGLSVIFISHKLVELLRLADRAIVMRKGKIVGNKFIVDTTEQELAHLMVGREISSNKKHLLNKTGNEVLKLESVVVSERGIHKLKEVSLAVHEGEIVGVAGVDGNGQTELEKAILGLIPVNSGSILLYGEEIKSCSTRFRLKKGIRYIPPDRQNQALLLEFNLADNLILGTHWHRPIAKLGWLKPKLILDNAKKLLHRFDVRLPDPFLAARSLSGGNQQKLVLARNLGAKPKLLIASQPIRGLDVGAIDFVHREIRTLQDYNGAILLISLDLDELIKLSSRIIVLYRGSIVAEFNQKEFDKTQIGMFMVSGQSS